MCWVDRRLQIRMTLCWLKCSRILIGISRPSTAKHHQVRTKIFSSDWRWVPTYGSSQTGLCSKVCSKVRSIKYSKLHTKANSEFHLRMKHLELDVPYFWPYFVAKSSLGRSIRRYVPWVWRKDFGSHLVVFRCEAWPDGRTGLLNLLTIVPPATDMFLSKKCALANSFHTITIQIYQCPSHLRNPVINVSTFQHRSKFIATWKNSS